MKKMQKTIGTSMMKKNDDDGKIVYGFGGEHIKIIYDYILKNNICSVTEIKK